MRVHADVYEVSVSSIDAQEVYCMADLEVYCVRRRFDRSECLADEGRSPLGALSSIESVDFKSHEVKR